MPINSRKKGARGEREIAEILRGYGYEARRSAQYCGNTGDAADVVGVAGLHIEVKYREQVRDEMYIEQAEHDARKGDLPLVFYRRSREQWKALLRLDTFMLIWGELSDTQKRNIHEKLKFM